MGGTPSRRRRALAYAATLLTAGGLLAACGGGNSGGPVVLHFYDNPGSDAAQQHVVDYCSKQSGGKYKIVYNKLPTSADSQRQQLVRRLAATDSSMDIMGLDVTWEAEFAEAGWVLPWTGQNKQQAVKGMLAGPLKTARWKGQLVAIPFNSNTQLLWYRSDLVKKPPTTWAQMIRMAQQLAKEGKPHYIEIQGRQYEGLTVWFNTLVASAGGSILNADSTAPSLGPPAVTAAQIMHNLATSSAADPSLSTQQEDDNRLQMEAGNAAFELNYPYVWPSAVGTPGARPMVDGKPLSKIMKWAPYPRVRADKEAAVTIGGVDLAISKYSKHPQEAFQAALCMHSTPAQKILAAEGGLPPVGSALYKNPPSDFAKAYPFYKLIGHQLDTAAVRPKTPAYQSVSIVISHTLSPPAGIRPQKDIDSLSSQISDALASKGLIP